MATPPVCEVRLCIGEHTQIDVQLPANSSLGTVLGDVEKYLVEYLDAAGASDELPDASQGWRLRTPIGTLLDNDKSLTDQAVRSGAALTLMAEPDGEAFSPRVESVSAAVAALGRKLFPAATPESVTAMLVWFIAALTGVAIGLLTVATFRSRELLDAGILAAAVSAVAATALINRQRFQRADVGDATKVLLAVFAPLSVSLLLPASMGPWTGPHLLIASSTLMALSLLFASTGRHVQAWTASTVVAIFVVMSQLANDDTMLPGPATTCALVVALVVALGRVELTAAWLARLPVPKFPSGSGRFVGRPAPHAGSDAVEATPPPDPALLLDRAVRANEILTGTLAAFAVIAPALTAVIAGRHPGQWPWLLFAAGIPVLFAYRCWSYAGRTNVLWLLAAVFASVAAGAVTIAATSGVRLGVSLLVVVLAVAALAPWTVPTPERPHSPLIRGVRVISEYVVTTAVLLAPLGLLRIPQMVYNRDFG